MPAAPVEVQITATGVDGVVRNLRLVRNETQALNDVTEEGTAISHSAARGLGELGRGLGQVAQSGELSAFALREFTGAAFRLGAEVGSAGLGAAIGLTVLAIGTLVEYLNKSGEAAKKAQQEFQSYIETLVHGSVVEASLAQAKLYSGDPSAMITGPREGESDIAFHARAGGQKYMEAEQARLQAHVDEMNRLTNTGTTATTQQKLERDSYIKQLKEINDLLDQNDLNLARISGVTDMLMGKEKELAAYQLQHLRDKRAEEHVGQAQLPFGTNERADYEAAMLRLYRPGFMGDQINPTGYGNLRSIVTGGQITGLKITAKQIPPNFLGEAQLAAEEQLDKFSKTLSRKFAASLGDGVAAGITAAFSSHSVLAGFEAAGETMLAGFGGVLQELGQTYIEYSGIMEAFAKFLPDPFTAGWAGLAIGAALEAMGAALGAIGQRHASGSYAGGGGGGALASQNSIAGSGNITILLPKGGSFLNPDDADAMEQLVDALKKVFGTRQVTTQEIGG